MPKKKRYSYIKKPFSKTGWYCAALGLLAVLLTAYMTVTSVRSRGNVTMFTASVGLSAILIDITGLVFVMNGIRERDRNHFFTLLGCLMLLAVLAIWIFILLFEL